MQPDEAGLRGVSRRRDIFGIGFFDPETKSEIFARRGPDDNDWIERILGGELFRTIPVLYVAVAPSAILGTFAVADSPDTPDRNATDGLIPTPQEQRADLVPRFCASRGISIKELAAAAAVHRADLHRWRKGQIPDTSAKAQRIEAVLQRGPVSQ